jgi:adenylate cyclase
MVYTRLLFRRVPSAPRCKLCQNPFGGVGGKLFGLAGFKPSRKNPSMCTQCCEKLPAGGAEVDTAVLFADVRSSTALGEQLGASAFAGALNRFYRTATGVLVAHDAVIDKLIGDEVMALFVRGISGADYRAKAVRAGEALLRAVGYGGSSEPWLPLGVGVHAGIAYVGNVGGGGVVDFTALGDTVNTTARLQAEAAPGELVLSQSLVSSLAEPPTGMEARVLDLKGKAEPFPVRVLRL